MPDLSHLWQRFVQGAALLAGLAIGVGATVFGYSNLRTVDIHWSVLQLKGVPLWAVVIVPITLILVTGTIFHWIDGLHHFTEHMRHRRRVHELEAEVSRLRAHLDQVLEMPRGEAIKAVEAAEDKPTLPAADLAATDAEMAGLEPAPDVDAKQARSGKPKRAKLLPETKPEEAEAPTAQAATTENGDAAVTTTATAANDAG